MNKEKKRGAQERRGEETRGNDRGKNPEQRQRASDCPVITRNSTYHSRSPVAPKTTVPRACALGALSHPIIVCSPQLRRGSPCAHPSPSTPQRRVDEWVERLTGQNGGQKKKEPEERRKRRKRKKEKRCEWRRRKDVTKNNRQIANKSCPKTTIMQTQTNKQKQTNKRTFLLTHFCDTLLQSVSSDKHINQNLRCQSEFG